MAGYQRFVAYVYEYQKGKKSHNCGFIKVEVRDRKCRMEVHLQCPGLTPEAKCRIYGFVRNAGLLDGYLLGTCMTGESMAECVLETDAQDMGGYGVPIGKTGGMILKTENGGFFGTEWDDQTIRPDNFREIRKKEPKQEKPLMDPEITGAEPEAEGQNQETADPEPETEKPDPETTDPESKAEKSNPETADPESEMSHTPEEEEPEVKLQSVCVQETEEAGEKNAEGDEVITEETAAERERNSREESEENRKDEGKMPEIGEPFDPFGDGSMLECRKIQLQDIPALSRCDCALRHNRFLLYGYYNFGHLLLCRKEDGSLILGVPGGYDQQERFMAGMFGFPYFRESREIELPKGKGGYWYRLIHAPNFH